MTPAGSGVQPLGIVRLIALLASLAAPPPKRLLPGDRNTARIRNLNCGLIAPDREASFVFMDKAQHSSGKNLSTAFKREIWPELEWSLSTVRLALIEPKHATSNRKRLKW